MDNIFSQPTIPFLAVDSSIFRKVVLKGTRYIAVSKRADLRLGYMKTEDGGSKEVALKQLRNGIVEKETERIDQIIESLCKYVELAHSFNQTNVVHIFGLSNIRDHVPYLILPYFSNGNIVNFLKENPGKTDSEKIELAKGILAGLAYLHQRGIFHGRMHGGNILVDDKGVALLCDAKFDSVMFGEDKYCSLHSKWWWMPHERLIPDDDADDSCPVAPPSMPADMYGAALTITQIWTLRRPFYAMRDEFELIRTLRELKSGKLAQLNRPEEVPKVVWSLLQGCLSIEPQARPTAQELLANFEALVAV